MRILIATSSNYEAFHGQAIFTKNLAQGLAKRGHEVLVVASSENGPYSTMELHGVHVISLRSISLRFLNPNAILALPAQGTIQQILEAFQPELVHIQDHYPVCRRTACIARKYGIPVIGTNHFMPENLSAYIPLASRIKPVYNWVLWHWMREVYDHLDAVVGPSQTAAEMLRMVGLKTKTLVISCGVNTELFRPLGDIDKSAWREKYGLCRPCTAIFFVGRVDREKKLDLIIRSLSILKREDIQLVIAGNGAAKGKLRGLAHQLNLEPFVHFTGFLPDDDLPSVLNSIDIFVMPSDAELLSIASLQAMACARPLLVADAVALPELVTEGENGLLFRSGDVKDAVHALAYLVDHPEKWPAMGSASLEKSKKHALDRIVLEYEALYSSMIESQSVKTDESSITTESHF